MKAETRDIDVSVVFTVRMRIIDKGETITYSPSCRFIEGCLLDLATTHGLKCSQIRFAPSKQELFRNKE